MSGGMTVTCVVIAWEKPRSCPRVRPTCGSCGPAVARRSPQPRAAAGEAEGGGGRRRGGGGAPCNVGVGPRASMTALPARASSSRHLWPRCRPLPRGWVSRASAEGPQARPCAHAQECLWGEGSPGLEPGARIGRPALRTAGGTGSPLSWRRRPRHPHPRPLSKSAPASGIELTSAVSPPRPPRRQPPAAHGCDRPWAWAARPAPPAAPAQAHLPAAGVPGALPAAAPPGRPLTAPDRPSGAFAPPGRATRRWAPGSGHFR